MRFFLWVAELVFAAMPLWMTLLVEGSLGSLGKLALCPENGPLTECKLYPAGPWSDLIILAFALAVSALFSLGRFVAQGESGRGLQGTLGALAILAGIASSVIYVLLGRQVLHNGGVLWAWVGGVVLVSALVSLVARLASKS